MSVSSVLAKNYENKSNPTLGENKPNSNPNKPNCWKAQNERKLSINKALRKYLGLWGPEKQSQTNPICQKAMNERNRLSYNELRK